MEQIFTPDQIGAFRDIILCVLAILAGFGIGYGVGSSQGKERAV